MIAQEYKAALGPKALENLIRTRVRDNEWRPSDIHYRLLRLPWKDVLTTNWDTLLERSVEDNPDLSYDMVRTTSDVARTAAPRIIKLHGSLPSHSPFILTEEDFRTYHREFPAFVNLARQILVENELCLIGFSGNDPNFLEWSGWVRDQLGSAARPVRLVGALNLSQSRRQYFQDRNVTVIDLEPAVRSAAPEDRYLRAVELFLDFLTQGKPDPGHWTICTQEMSSDKDTEKFNIAKLTDQFLRDRTAYPGWLIAPIEYRLQIRSDLAESVGDFRSSYADASQSETLALLFEIVWRCQLCFVSLPDAVEEKLLEIISTDGDQLEAMENRLLLRKSLAQSARRRLDMDAFAVRVQWLQDLGTRRAETEASYERCLLARDVLDYDGILAHVDGVEGEDPIWMLRKAALLCELGDSYRPVELIYQAFRELRGRRAQSPRSIWILSREAWATWMLGGARYELSKLGIEYEKEYPGAKYREARADPWDEIHWLGREIVDMQRDRVAATRPRIPSFDPGSYVVPGRKFYGTAKAFPDSETLWLSEVVGIPLRLGHTDVLASKFASASLSSLQDDDLRLWWLVRSAANGQLEAVKEHFSRTSVARMSRETVEELVDRIMPAVRFLASRVEYSTGNRVSQGSMARATMAADLLEVLSFLSSRCNSDQALRLIAFAAALSEEEEISSPKSFPNLAALIARSIRAVKPSKRSDLCLTVLKLPLARETKRTMKETVNWSAVLENVDRSDWRKATRTSEWSGVIERLLRAIGDGECHLSRTDAIHRLFEAREAMLLTDEEDREFGKAIWGHLNPDGTPKASNFLPHVYRLLPGADEHNVEGIYRKLVIDELSEGRFSEQALAGLHGSAFDRDGNYQPVLLAKEDADRVLERMLDWRPRPRAFDPFSRQEWEDREISILIGRCLMSTVVQSSTVFEGTGDKAKELLGCIRVEEKPFLIPAAMVVGNRIPELQTEAMRVIQKGLISQDGDTIGIALNAILWSLKAEGVLADQLLQDTLSVCLMRREPGLLGALVCVQEFVERKLVPESEIDRLVGSLELLWAETEYSRWLDEARGADIGLLRGAVVKLCSLLEKMGCVHQFLTECLESAKRDPMPEVRFAEGE